jgi:uncharacterized protein YceK
MSHFVTRHFIKPTIILLLGLTGCSSVSETFDSAPGQGVGAKPITVVNHMVEHKKLKGSSLSENVITSKPYSSVFLARGSIQRSTEKTMCIWIAPYIDEQGHLHEASRVHTVIQPSAWNVGQENTQGGK